MTSSHLVRLGALAIFVSGILIVIADLLRFLTGIEFENVGVAAARDSWLLITAAYLLGTVLLLGGLLSLHARQSEAAGVPGLVGFLAAFLGAALAMGINWAQVFVLPSLAVEAPIFLRTEQVAGALNLWFMVTGLLFAAGLLLFGVATLWAGVYPRAAAIVLVVGALIEFASVFVQFPLNNVVSAVGGAWLGFTLLSGRLREGADQQPAR
jgi:hypothetical protein